MFTLKILRREALPSALEKAHRYRLLNEPSEAESICLDILRTDPDNQEALVTLILAVTDRFGQGFTVHAEELEHQLARLTSEYERCYYRGVIAERRGKAQLRSGVPGFMARPWFQEAMSWYEKAENLRPPDNDDALLRWNTCARILNANPALAESAEDSRELPLE